MAVRFRHQAGLVPRLFVEDAVDTTQRVVI